MNDPEISLTKITLCFYVTNAITKNMEGLKKKYEFVAGGNLVKRRYSC